MKITKIISFLILLSFLSACEQTPTLERIQQQGTLLIATKNNPSTFYSGENGTLGFEYELARNFALSLNLEPKFILFKSNQAITQAIKTAQVHMAAAGLYKQENNAPYTESASYQSVALHLLYRRGSTKPRNLDALDGRLGVAKDSGYTTLLNALQAANHDINWSLENETEDMLDKLNLGIIDYTIANDLELKINQSFYPYIRKAFTLSDEKQWSWIFPASFDASVQQAANHFLQQQSDNKFIQQLTEKYFTNLPERGFVDNRNFWRHVDVRLPTYKDLFLKAAKATGIDWRLLAAVGYQESHWNPQAVSPTGVRGIMMLTQDTAKQLGLTNRMDPEQSIMGGAQHIIWSAQRLPDRIQDKKDRLWFSLAAYNIGYGHLEDARILTQRQGGDPDKWSDVKLRLPLLKNEQYYSKLKHGYARGTEPVTYVSNIQHYYRMMIHLDNQGIHYD